HAAAVAERERTRVQGFQAANQRRERVVVRGTRRRIRAIEIWLDENVFAVEPRNTEQLDGLLHPCGAVGGFHESYVGHFRGGWNCAHCRNQRRSEQRAASQGTVFEEIAAVHEPSSFAGEPTLYTPAGARMVRVSAGNSQPEGRLTFVAPAQQ